MNSGLQQTPKSNKGHYFKKEVYELKMTTQNKEELNQDMENLRKRRIKWKSLK
jgi:hypothetical protein